MDPKVIEERRKIRMQKQKERELKILEVEGYEKPPDISIPKIENAVSPKEEIKGNNQTDPKNLSTNVSDGQKTKNVDQLSIPAYVKKMRFLPFFSSFILGCFCPAYGYDD